MSPDKINCLFEALGGVALIISIRTLLRHKQVRGFNPLMYAYFSSWGFWNLYYYPNLHQWWSFTASLLLAQANLLYMILGLYYSHKERKANEQSQQNSPR